MKTYKYIASVLGIGYVPKGGGTVAALLALAIWYWFIPLNFWIQIPIVIGLFFLGVFVSDKLEAQWGKDSGKIVLDEVLGMLIAVLLLPKTPLFAILGFVLFRFFDIVKPLGIRKCEGLKGGLGVMADDALSGLYTLVILWVLFYTI